VARNCGADFNKEIAEVAEKTISGGVVTSANSACSLLKSFRSLAAFTLFLSAVLACENRESIDGTIAFTNVSVIDARSPEAQVDRTVVISGNRIVAEGPSATTPAPDGARVIDGSGLYVIPGLWDMHVHLTMPGGRDVLPLYVLNGVTGVRDMASEWEQLQAMRRDIAGGLLVGPRIISSGPYLEGGDVPIPHLLVKTPADAEPAVDSLIKLGVDFIKVHGQLTPESYYAIARVARARRIPFAGHVSRTIGAANASDSGQASIEHILSIPNPCTPAEVVELAPRFPVQAALGRCDTTDQAPLYAKLQRNSTWVVPTLVAQLEVSRWPKRDLPGDSVGQYLPDSLRTYVAGIFPMVDSVPPDADVNGAKVFAKRVSVTGALFRAGVGVMTGTDAPLRNSPPGFGLHEELLHLTQAGLTPWEALKAATYEPARFLGAFDSLGTVEAGKVADLVLLSADPLADIRNSSRTVWVVANGKLHEIRRDRQGRLLQGNRK
jgi:imidazolonepropionase-like amidohydrolase